LPHGYNGLVKLVFRAFFQGSGRKKG
jgi:hypothetical protein